MYIILLLLDFIQQWRIESNTLIVPVTYFLYKIQHIATCVAFTLFLTKQKFNNFQRSQLK